MKKRNIAISIGVILISILVIFKVTKCNVFNNIILSLNNDIETEIICNKEEIKSNEEIELVFNLKTKEDLTKYINVYRAKLEFDDDIFELDENDFTLYNSWSDLKYNAETHEFIIINLDNVSSYELILKVKLKVKESITNNSNTAITISNMETGNWNTKEDIEIYTTEGNNQKEINLIINNENDSNEDEIIVIAPDDDKVNETTKPIYLTTTTKRITTTKKKTKTSSTTKRTTTTQKISTKTTTQKTTIKTSTKTTSTSHKNNNERDKDLDTNNNKNEENKKDTSKNKLIKAVIIFIVLIIIFFLLYRNEKNKGVKGFIALILISIIFASSIVKATSIIGDINIDGKIDISDVQLLEEHLIGIKSLDDDLLLQADANTDEKISTVDLAIIIKLMLDDENKTNEEGENTKTAYEVIKEIKIGWNLGNTLDSANYKKEFLGEEKAIYYYETLWGNPKTTKEMIDQVKKAGFNSIRVPVTYYDHILPDGTIDEIWFARIEEVINYVLDDDLYCILDVHHDTGLYEGGSWIVADAELYEENAKKLSDLWLQIANRFKDYDYKLIFEGLNETVDTKREGYNWDIGLKHTLTVMKLNQVFVDTVRGTGGKNKSRILAVTTYGGITDEHKLSNFSLPNDIVQDKIILALHDYAEDENNIANMMQRLKKYLVDKNIPVMLDEFGTKANMSEERRAEIANYYVSNAKKLGIPCYWWDDGGNYQLFDRRNNTWKYEKIKDALIEASR